MNEGRRDEETYYNVITGELTGGGGESREANIQEDDEAGCDASHVEGLDVESGANSVD
jgi:hypothetical protein